jgi:hypothetical protein
MLKETCGAKDITTPSLYKTLLVLFGIYERGPGIIIKLYEWKLRLKKKKIVVIMLNRVYTCLHYLF